MVPPFKKSDFIKKTMSDYIDLGNGTPVVLLHSSMSSKAQWGNLCERLRHNFRVIAIDLYGYGDANFPECPEHFSLMNEAERINRLLTKLLDGTPFHLTGHSYGGATALRLAYEIQPQLLSLSLYEPVAFHLLPKKSPALKSVQQIASKVEQLVKAGDRSRATACFIDFWSGPGTYANLDTERQRNFTRYITKVILDFQAGMGEPLSISDYEQLTLPVCLVRSPQSPHTTRQIAQLIAQHLPKLELHEVEGGHLAPLSHSHLVNPIFEQFVGRIEQQATTETT